MLGKSIVILFYFAIVIFACRLRNVTGQFRCRNPNRKYGYCVSIYECPSLIEVISRISLTAAEREFLANSQCSNGFGNPPYVCCTPDTGYTGDNIRPAPNQPPMRQTTTPRPNITNSSPSNGLGNVLPEPPNCGPNTLADKIYNGNDTALDEYPWMVLLEYNGKGGRRLDCSGSLINQRYVLTAGHCVVGEIETAIGPLSRIRLGEYDITSEIDCIREDCNNKVTVVGFEEVIPHPEYDPASNNRYHDIALIRLDTDVTYTDFIRPVCLPLVTTRMAIDVGEKLIVAGWGHTILKSQSDTKKQLEVPVNDYESCARKYIGLKEKINLIPSQLCAGGEFAKDSCHGDSGGPLMRRGNQNRWYLEGVVSFGHKCGQENWPGVYTRVADYVDWIQRTLRP